MSSFIRMNEGVVGFCFGITVPLTQYGFLFAGIHEVLKANGWDYRL